MLSVIAGVASAIPSIIKLFDSDERDQGVKELTNKVVDEAGKALGVSFNSKADVVSHLNANPQDALKLAELETKHAEAILAVVAADKKDARAAHVAIQGAKDWLVRNTGSIIALITVIGAFCLDTFILYKGFTAGMSELNPVVTLIAGHISARAGQVLSFYFGMSKSHADEKRK